MGSHRIANLGIHSILEQSLLRLPYPRSVLIYVHVLFQPQDAGPELIAIHPLSQPRRIPFQTSVAGGSRRRR